MAMSLSFVVYCHEFMTKPSRPSSKGMPGNRSETPAGNGAKKCKVEKALCEQRFSGFYQAEDNQKYENRYLSQKGKTTDLEAQNN